MTNKSANFDKSELGQTLKSSIIKRTLTNHKNDKKIESNFVCFAKNIKSNPSTINIRLDRIELNNTIEVNIISPHKKYITFSEYLDLVNQIYNSIFHNIALHTYQPINTIDLSQPEVIAYQLPSWFIWIHLILPHVIKAHKACQNSCRNVTNKFIGYNR